MPRKAEIHTSFSRKGRKRNAFVLFDLSGGKAMSETKVTKKQKKEPTKEPKAKKNECLYRGLKYKVIEETEDKLKLTDGIIHFWAKKADVERVL